MGQQWGLVAFALPLCMLKDDLYDFFVGNVIGQLIKKQAIFCLTQGWTGSLFLWWRYGTVMPQRAWRDST